MKIVSVLGSPRVQGNSAAIARRFLAVAAGLGADTASIHQLSNMQYGGCRACYACKGTTERCVLRDDLTPVLLEIEEADLLLLATPVYFSDMCGQMKLFIDRFYAFLVPNFHQAQNPTRLKPKKLALIVTQGHPDPEWFKDIIPRYDGMLKRLGFVESRYIRACGTKPGSEDLIPENVLLQADAAARDLVQA